MTENEPVDDPTWRDLKDARQKGLRKKRKAIEKSVSFLLMLMEELNQHLKLEDSSMIVFQKKEVYDKYYHVSDGKFLDGNSIELVDGRLTFCIAIGFNYTKTIDIHPIDMIYQHHDEYECFLFKLSWQVDDGADVYDVDNARFLRVDFLGFSRVYDLETFKIEDITAHIAIRMVFVYMDFISKNPCDPRLRIVTSAYPSKVTP